VICANTTEEIKEAIWVIDLGGPKEARIRWGPDSSCEGAGFNVPLNTLYVISGKLQGERICPDMPDDTMP